MCMGDILGNQIQELKREVEGLPLPIELEVGGTVYQTNEEGLQTKYISLNLSLQSDKGLIKQKQGQYQGRGP